jgi:serine/threonine protein kinase
MASPHVPSSVTTSAQRAHLALAEQSKLELEQQLSKRREQLIARTTRRLAVEANLVAASSDKERTQILAAHEEIEREISRRERKRPTVQDYNFLVLIGRGAFGEVHVVRSIETGKVFALKSMQKSVMVAKNQIQHVRTERDALAHGAKNVFPFLIHLEESFQNQNELFLVVTFAPGGDLMSLLIKEDVLPEQAVKMVCAECIVAIAQLHKLGYIHRDLKPDNLLISSTGHIRLADLGLSIALTLNNDVETYISDKKDDDGDISQSSFAGLGGEFSPPLKHKLAYSTVGTPDYIAPEVLKKDGYTSAIDWWSLGVIIYECLIGFTPFFAETPVQTCKKILNHHKYLQFPRDRIKNVSVDALAFIRTLICDEKTRFKDYETIISHAWFKDVDFSSLEKEDYLNSDGPLKEFIPPSLQSSLLAIEALPKDTPASACTALVRELTSCFDDMTSLKPDDPRSAPLISSLDLAPQKRFPGFTFKSSSSGNSSSGSGSSSSVIGSGETSSGTGETKQ